MRATEFLTIAIALTGLVAVWPLLAVGEIGSWAEDRIMAWAHRHLRRPSLP